MLTSPNDDHDDRRYSSETLSRLAEDVRSACIDAARQGYEEARIGGLCHEGAWENAISAMQMVDVSQIAARLE